MLHELFADLSPLITIRSAAAAFTAFLLCLLVSPLLIGLLRKRKINDPVEKKFSDLLTEMHRSKNGTPTMGGLILLVAVLGAAGFWGYLDNSYLQVTLLVMVALGLVGFLDDYIKLTNPKRHGMSIRQKLLLQSLVGIAAGLFLQAYFTSQEAAIVLFQGDDPVRVKVNLEGTFLYLPIFRKVVELGAWYPLFVALVVVSASNAVNLTDGLDGLAIGCVTMSGLAVAVITYVVGRIDFTRDLGLPYVPGAGELTILAAALVGAGMGFLWFNCFPAQIFMGNTGSLPLGGAIGMIAVSAKHELALFLVGAIFVIETLSVLLQIISFRGWGRRIFRIAPLHHHYQFCGLHESKITIRFWILSAILALMSLATLKM